MLNNAKFKTHMSDKFHIFRNVLMYKLDYKVISIESSCTFCKARAHFYVWVLKEVTPKSNKAFNVSISPSKLDLLTLER